jgi:putative nucleotidyltransferase with HDIG domain
MPAEKETPVWTRDEDGARLLANHLSEAVRGGNGQTLNVAGRFGASMLTYTGAGTAQHSKEVVLIAEAIGQKLGVLGQHAANLRAAAQLHDIGKACIPRRILEKPGRLDEPEWGLMRRHTIMGERILSSVTELQEIARIVRHSHERWDGGGYPDGLEGEQIPLASRIIFCADAFHAIRTDRPYRPGRSALEAVAEIERCAGSQFDPCVAEALTLVVYERGRLAKGADGSGRLFALSAGLPTARVPGRP